MAPREVKWAAKVVKLSESEGLICSEGVKFRKGRKLCCQGG